MNRKEFTKGVSLPKAAIPILIMLLAPFPAAAQSTGSYVYGLGGPVIVPKSAFTRWNGNFIHLGGGGEGRLTDRFALGGEIGVLKPVTNPYAMTTGVVTVTPAWHFFPRSSKSKLDPFVNGGLTLLLGRGGAAGGIHYGGGVNYWVRRRVGLRFEFRDHLWSPESGETVHLVEFRAGIVVRIG